MTLEIRTASVYYGAQEWRKDNDKYYVHMFGTSGPGQSPHWFWGEVDIGRVPEAVMLALR